MNFVRRKRALPRTLNRIIYWITVFLIDDSFLNIYNAFPLAKEGRTFKTDESRPLTTNRLVQGTSIPLFGRARAVKTAIFSAPVARRRFSSISGRRPSRERLPLMCSFIWPRVTYLPGLCPSINYRPQLLPAS